MLLTTRSRATKKIVREHRAAIDTNRDNLKRQIAPHNPLTDSLSDGAWRDEPCFLIGGGPSLRGFDFERLRGRGKIIVINRAYEFVQFADLLFFMDWKFYKLCHEEPERRRLWESFAGRKVFLNLMGRKVDDCFSVRSAGRSGISWHIGKGLYHGNNSGHGALNLALALGARPIYLLGYDMKNDAEGHTHFHSGYGLGRMNPNVARSFVKEFVEMAKRIPQIDYIYNLNPLSGLRAFRFKAIDEVLNGQAIEDLGRNVADSGDAVRIGPSA
jgi:hypothetical protein